jgi:hypothetical protein
MRVQDVTIATTAVTTVIIAYDVFLLIFEAQKLLKIYRLCYAAVVKQKYVDNSY